MKKIVSLSFPGVPKAVQSFRFASAGRFARKYQPKDTVEWKNYIRILALRQTEGAMQMIGRGTPLVIEALFVFPLNKTARKAEREAVESGAFLPHTKKPDVADNLMKGLCDALTGTVWEDDSVITAVRSVKCTGAEPMIRLNIYEASPDDVDAAAKGVVDA